MFLWLVCASAGAVGLGGVELQSSPGQPLEAEIPIDLVTAQQLWRLQVGVAPAQTFERNGLDRAAELDDLRFEIVRGSEGRSVVRITSPDSLTLPVSLLVEATWLRGSNWPPGRLVRQYTLAPQTASAAGAESPPAGAGTLESYGPIRTGDTLWSLADRFRPAGVHTNQMMVAIFEANPRGFGGNMNGLYLGAALRIPEAVQALRLTVEEATEESVRQMEAWVSDPERQAGLGLPAPRTGAAVAAPDAGTAPGADELQAELEEARRLIELRDEQLQALRTQLMEAQAATQAAEAAAAELAAAPPPARPPGPLALWARLIRAASRADNTVVPIGAGALLILGILAGFLFRQRRRAVREHRSREETPVAEAADDEPPSGASAAGAQASMEIESQLDLARAYADMGDADAARKTLQGVIEAGDPAQREQAAALLASIEAQSGDNESRSGDDTD